MNQPEDRVERVAAAAVTSLTPPPRAVPMAFRLAELLPFRWWYLWTLLIVAVAPIALWIQLPTAFAGIAVLTLAGIYGVQLRAARTRIGLLKWGRVATITDIETLYGYLSVSGVTNTITVTGHCTSVSVSGYRIHVTIDSTDAISASGTGNVVTDHWGSPRIANAGTSNSILQG